MVGGAWPFLVGGVICLLNCVNERDLNLLNSDANPRRQTAGATRIRTRAPAAAEAGPDWWRTS